MLEQHLMGPLLGLVARLRGLSPNSVEVKLQVFFLVGRVLVFRTVRTSALELLNWPEFTPDRIETITNLLREEVQLLFKHD